MAQNHSHTQSATFKKALTLANKIVAESQHETFKTYLRHYYDGISVQDMHTRDSDTLLGCAHAHWLLAARRPKNQPRIRIYNPTLEHDGWSYPHTVCDIITDDMPFLVDSLRMLFVREGLPIHLTIHPIYSVQRGARATLENIAPSPDANAITESFLHFELGKTLNRTQSEALKKQARAVLDDIRIAVDDWADMRTQAANINAELDARHPHFSLKSQAQARDFLDWLNADHFTFLGYREYDLVEKNGEPALQAIKHSGLGILRHGETDEASHSFEALPKDVREKARKRELIIITKANSQSNIHRQTYMDYIGIKRFNDAGDVIGERRFLGLFTSSAYRVSPRQVPILKDRVDYVLKRSALPYESHDGKALVQILDTLPRDELFQASDNELYKTADGILALQERNQTRLFIRTDRFKRFYACLVYLPRERYNTTTRECIQAIIKTQLHADSLKTTADLSESRLACVYIVARATITDQPKPNIKNIQAQIHAAVQSWQDRFDAVLRQNHDDNEAIVLSQRFSPYFTPTYQDDVSVEQAVNDIEHLAALNDVQPLQMALYQPSDAADDILHFRLFRRHQPIAISTALPMLENLGMTLISEQPYVLDTSDDTRVWIQDFEMRAHDVNKALSAKSRFKHAFVRVLNAEAENDLFNRLIIDAGIDWRETAMLRAYCKYLLQTAVPFSQRYIENTLVSNASFVTELIELFHCRFDPTRNDRKRNDATSEQLQSLRTALNAVASLDEDRILRSFMTLINATLRTNYYQTTRDADTPHALAFKLDSSTVPDLPLPRPMTENFVYSPRFEAIHLRGSKVARGGIRWSDRPEDFRTEVLGLMKAQMVKNTVIVPAGSKGGFVLKRPPSARDELKGAVKECYQHFMRAMLDLTDNLMDGAPVAPTNVVCHDPSDPYLVVAADKGTAGFSDLANGVAREYNYWLDDAFASGGSAGYDHKAMGITARGGWESVKRHFREMGTDIQKQDFTAVGIGDMGGDVFGNGMLCSAHTRLVAAFNHMHIFIDPTPNAAASFKERRRLYQTPGTTWADYNKALISKGGGVFSRSEKAITLTREMQHALGTDAKTLPPHALIRVILKAPVDLLWNGGIGTYVKARRETQADVGDHNNDILRINGGDLRCKVVGEGGNLGFTQLGRIEYAQTGGRINTDFVDNSAGVNCSDHEVNIKILLNIALAQQKLDIKKRKKLLTSMTEEVAQLVLNNNYQHSQTLSIAEAQAAHRIGEHAYLIRELERTDTLNREVEFLPSDEEIEERAAAGDGLTRPEIAVLVAYAKIQINAALLDSNLPEDPHLGQQLTHYFPTPLSKAYQPLMGEHRLQREIITMKSTNNMVNRMGPTFVQRLKEETGADAATITRAYTIAREVFSMPHTWQAIEALDNHISGTVQLDMHIATINLIRHATHWLLANKRNQLDINPCVHAFKPGVAQLAEHMDTMLQDTQKTNFLQHKKEYDAQHADAPLSATLAALPYLYGALDIVNVANNDHLKVATVGKIYYAVGARLQLNVLHQQIRNLSTQGHWQAIARGSLREDLYRQQRRLAAFISARKKARATPEKAIDDWWHSQHEAIERHQDIISDMLTATTDFPTLTVAIQQTRKLADISKE